MPFAGRFCSSNRPHITDLFNREPSPFAGKDAMAAPIYTQAQVAAMIATPKYVPHDAWNGRSEGREGTDEVRNRIEAHPIDENDSTQFLIERCRCAARGEASFTLFGRLSEYVQQPLCRYEIQICRHSNPKWFSGPSYISARVPHKHV